MKILIIQTAFLGDVILATPLVEKIHRFYPEAGIDFLLRKGNENLLAGHPYLRQLLIWNKKMDKYRGLWALSQQIRTERYDWVINCQRFAASGLLTAFSGARASVGFDKNPFSRFFSRRVKHRIGDANHPVHEVERNLDLIRHLTDERLERPRLYPSEAHFEKAQRLASGNPYVCIAPTSVWYTKQFPAHKWVELIRALPASQQVFLLGGPDDVAACEHIRASSDPERVRNLAGQLSLMESVALMAQATMNYVNDSAPLHMASAMNAPVAAVFCSTVPAFGFTPLSDRQAVVETKLALDCRPCGLHGHAACPKGHFACAESVDITAFPFPSQP